LLPGLCTLRSAPHQNQNDDIMTVWDVGLRIVYVLVLLGKIISDHVFTLPSRASFNYINMVSNCFLDINVIGRSFMCLYQYISMHQFNLSMAWMRIVTQAPSR
jgi:hypothetical protein